METVFEFENETVIFLHSCLEVQAIISSNVQRYITPEGLHDLPAINLGNIARVPKKWQVHTP